MPTETTTDSTEATEVAQEATETTATVDDEPLGDGGKRALTAEREARKAAEKRLAELEAADQARRESEMTELEKAQARLAELERANAESATRALRAEIAAETGVPAGLLTGDTEDAMRASAAALVAFKGSVPKAPTTEGQGNVGTPVGSAKQLTDADLSHMSPAEINKARREGRLDHLLGKS